VIVAGAAGLLGEEFALSTELLIALVTLTLMEIVLGIDNVIFIAIVAGRLPKEQQAKARRVGLMVALLTRLLLLGLLFVLAQLDKVVVFSWTSLGVPEGWLSREELRNVSVKDLVLLLGGMFLIAKSTMEIHHKLEGDEEVHAGGGGASFASTIIQISLLDIVFSLDSVITAIGMVKAESATDWAAIGVMVTAMVIAMGVMLLFAGFISDFVGRHPTIKILALAFLILIGVMLVAEGTGRHMDKGYIYFAMAFSVVVEMLNLRLRAKAAPVALHERHMPKEG
jgi:predicted tellurium resistance membrane protein TerC